MKVKTLEASLTCKAKKSCLIFTLERFSCTEPRIISILSPRRLSVGKEAAASLWYKGSDSWQGGGISLLQYKPCSCIVIFGFCCTTPGERIGTWRIIFAFKQLSIAFNNDLSLLQKLYVYVFRIILINKHGEKGRNNIFLYFGAINGLEVVVVRKLEKKGKGTKNLN